jgi:predicted nucleic acid-binding protein
VSGTKGLVLDANILLRAVFGKRVRQILEKYENEARFYTPDVCFRDARKYIPVISRDRRFDTNLGLSVLGHVGRVIEQVDRSIYEGHENVARERLAFEGSRRLAGGRDGSAVGSTDLDRGSGFFR